MEEGPLRRLAVLLHADVAGSTSLVRIDETLAHQRIQDTFRRLAEAVAGNRGTVLEVRGDAVVAEFPRVSDSVEAALSSTKELNCADNASLATVAISSCASIVLF